MTARKRKPAPPVYEQYVRRGGNGGSASEGPSFGVVWKWMMGVASAVMVAAMIAAFTWMWNMQDSMTKMIGAVVVNADSVKSLATVVDRLQQSDSSQATTLAQTQVQITNMQTNSSNANITLSARIERIESSLGARIDSIEREARWRANAQLPGGVGGRR